MSRENVEIVRGIQDAFERRDFAAIFAVYDPEIEWHVARLGDKVAAEADPVYIGHDGVRRFWREWLDAWEAVEFEYEELIDAGNEVVVVLSQRMRGRTSGVELEWKSYAQVWTVRDGKIVRSEFFQTRAEALEAVGLRE